MAEIDYLTADGYVGPGAMRPQPANPSGVGGLSACPEVIGRCLVQRRRVLIHRLATGVCVTLALPAVLWWSRSVLFVILISLATQAWTSWGAAEAAEAGDDSEILERLARIEAQLGQRGAGDA